MSLSQAARRLQRLLGEHGAVIGGVCAAVHGVERFTRDVDFATDLSVEELVDRLRGAGLEVTVRRSDTAGDLPWVVCGNSDDVPFQLLPAESVGIDVHTATTRAGLRVPSVEAFMRSKCIAGGQQDLHDVAVLCLLDSELEPTARALADERGVLGKLEAWFEDRRLRQRHQTDSGDA